MQLEMQFDKEAIMKLRVLMAMFPFSRLLFII